jgi:hypothetical protein
MKGCPTSSPPAKLHGNVHVANMSAKSHSNNGSLLHSVLAHDGGEQRRSRSVGRGVLVRGCFLVWEGEVEACRGQ